MCGLVEMELLDEPPPDEVETAFGPADSTDEGAAAGAHVFVERGLSEETAADRRYSPSAKDGSSGVVITSVNSPRPFLERVGSVEDCGLLAGQREKPSVDLVMEESGLWSDASSGYEWDGGSDGSAGTDDELVGRPGVDHSVDAPPATEFSNNCAPNEAAQAGQRMNLDDRNEPTAESAQTALLHVDVGAAGTATTVAAGAGVVDESADDDPDTTAQMVAAAPATTAAVLAAAAAEADTENGDGTIRNGFGIKIWRDSSKYMGDWTAGKMTGYGEMRWADGRRYVGDWHDNRCHGKGVLTYKDGRQYVGEYKKDKMHGKGVYEWSEGARYIGHYREHRKHGRGIMTWKTGGRYDGQYVDDKMTGYGRFWAPSCFEI